MPGSGYLAAATLGAGSHGLTWFSVIVIEYKLTIYVSVDYLRSSAFGLWRLKNVQILQHQNVICRCLSFHLEIWKVHIFLMAKITCDETLSKLRGHIIVYHPGTRK